MSTEIEKLEKRIARLKTMTKLAFQDKCTTKIAQGQYLIRQAMKDLYVARLKHAESLREEIVTADRIKINYINHLKTIQ